MKSSTKIWLGVIVVLALLLCVAWVGLGYLFYTSDSTDLLAFLATETPRPTATNTPLPEPSDTPTPESSPTPTEPPADTPTPTRAPIDTPTPLPPFPTPQAIRELDERPLRIGYMANPDDNWDIFIAAEDGSDPQNVSNNDAFDAFASWSPHNERLTWITRRFGEGAEVVVADIEGNKLANVSNQVNSDDFSPAWSPNGQLITFLSTRFRDGEVFISLPDGTAYNLSDNEANDIFFDWSPTCAALQPGDSWEKCTILMGSTRSTERGGFGDEYTLLTINPDGGNLNFVRDSELRADEAIFSPDGSQIAYLKQDRQAETIDLYLYDLDAQTETRLTEDEVIKTNIAWSPDGTHVGYVSIADVAGAEPRPNDIYTVSVPGGEVTLLTDPADHDVINADFKWSPDGSQILFSSLRDGNPEIYRMDADGGNPTNLTNTPRVAELEPFWIE